MLYCLKCKQDSDDACPKKLIMMTNIKIKGVTRCSECLAFKLFVDKIKNNDQLEVIVSQFLLD